MSFDCNCIQLRIFDGKTLIVDEINSSGDFNGQPYWEYTYDSVLIYLFWDTDRWYINDVFGSTIDPIAELQVFGCPFGKIVFKRGFKIDFEIFPCGSCVFFQERVEEEFRSVKLPEVFEEQNRGFFRCCCPFNVLASGGPTWENDITSAWIKLSSLSDTTSAVLLKHGVPTVYTPTIQSFPNDPNAYYWTINWNDVLLSDGVGCYSLQINYNISGVSGDFTWGIYNLLPFTIQNALKTARLRVKFNSYQEIEGINFTGANVEDTIRFHGFIGFRQPNMEIDNLIYKNREVKKVKRENLNTYEVITDPTCEEHIKKLTDLYLLSENELFISDYNAHNHSYRYQDLPAVVEESPEITYFDFARSASLKCIVGDKKKDKRSFYNGGLNLLSGPTGGQVSAPVCAPAVVENTTATFSTTVASGGILILPDETITITDQLGNPLDFITFPVYSSVNIDIDSYTPPCADATYDLEDTAGAPLASGTIPSGGSDTIVAPDATIENSNASYSVTEVSGGTLVLPDSDIEVNGVLEGTIPSVETVDIQVTDGVVPVTPTAVTVLGNTVTIEVPVGGGAPVGATLMRTGQTTVFRTGDDADTSSEGRATDFFTLASNNPFGNTDRFTDELGTQTYADDIVIDWSTYDGSTVLGYRRTRNGANVIWPNAIDEALLVSVGTFTSGWRLPNFNELNNILNWNTLGINYSPFNVGLSSTIAIWCSTTTTSAYRLGFNNLFTAANKTTASAHYIPCRTFTVTGTTLT